MKNISKFIVALAATSMLTCCTKAGEFDDVKYVYNEDEMYEKVWEGNIVHNESVVLIEGDDGRFSGRLLYKPEKVVCVKDHSLQTTYSPDTDYYVEDDRIYMKNGSKMPHLTKKNLTTEEVPQIFITGTGGEQLGTYDGKTAGTKILFTEGVGVIFSQIMVTYCHKDTWKGTVPTKKGSKLPKLREILNNKGDLNVVTWGDSIFCGCNASGLKGLEPFQDPFPNAFPLELQRIYGVNAYHKNNSVGGMLSSYGNDNAGAIFADSPDLLVIGFGMNDGSFNVSPAVYKSHIENMIVQTKAKLPNVSIIACATILPNPNSPQAKGNHIEYLPVLLELEDTYDDVAVLDMTTFSIDLFEKKNSLDLLANNINHPADWLTRLYVANLMNLIEVA